MSLRKLGQSGATCAVIGGLTLAELMIGGHIESQNMDYSMPVNLLLVCLAVFELSSLSGLYQAIRTALAAFVLVNTGRIAYRCLYVSKSMFF